jgi:hypothetical protein
MNWLPIQLAPRDGTRILAVCPGPRMRIVRFDAADDRLPIGDIRGDMWPDVPTHFMPLPSDPYGVAVPHGQTVPKAGTDGGS